jgi:hypothetical protein
MMVPVEAILQINKQVTKCCKWGITGPPFFNIQGSMSRGVIAANEGGSLVKKTKFL